MVICPIARTVHCTGCALVKICPAKTWLGDYAENDEKKPAKDTETPPNENLK
jgi:hypothetical protein